MDHLGFPQLGGLSKWRLQLSLLYSYSPRKTYCRPWWTGSWKTSDFAKHQGETSSEFRETNAALFLVLKFKWCVFILHTRTQLLTLFLDSYVDHLNVYIVLICKKHPIRTRKAQCKNRRTPSGTCQQSHKSIWLLSTIQLSAHPSQQPIWA